MVYQEPSRALNPSLRVGAQVAEVFALTGMDKQAASEATADMLRTVRIADPAAVMRRYPHELSGGMAQRVVIAMALAASPELLILDEPTTALDATVEAEVLDLIAALRTEYNTSVLFISHNLAVIAKVCDRVGVLYAGSMVEEGAAGIVFRKPAHPYTVGLLRSVPRRGQRKEHGPLPVIPGFLPRPDEVGAGCMFASRCPLVVEQCRTSAPPPFVVEPGGYLAATAGRKPKTRRTRRARSRQRPGQQCSGQQRSGRRRSPAAHRDAAGLQDLPRRRAGTVRRQPGRDRRPDARDRR